MPNTLETARYIVTHSQNVSFFPLLSSIDEKVKNIRYLRTHPEELRRRVVLICRRGDPFRRRFEQIRGDLSPPRFHEESPASCNNLRRQPLRLSHSYRLVSSRLSIRIADMRLFLRGFSLASCCLLF
ncbi:hypothetical protein CWS02_06210 [Enterobacter sp. EA-1]|nr:hypothetical protein CWS02_06210 [Enterobacter sp. EA-1]